MTNDKIEDYYLHKQKPNTIKDEKYYLEVIKTLVSKIWELKGQIHGLKKARELPQEDDDEIPY